MTESTTVAFTTFPQGYYCRPDGGGGNDAELQDISYIGMLPQGESEDGVEESEFTNGGGTLTSSHESLNGLDVSVHQESYHTGHSVQLQNNQFWMFHCQRTTKEQSVFDDCHEDFQKAFQKAVVAIMSKDTCALEQAVNDICMEARRHPVKGHHLDICYPIEGVGDYGVYYMTLLAFCAFHGQKEMADYLLQHGADIDTGNIQFGTPLLQMMAHCHGQECEKKLDISMIQYFIDRKASLNKVKIYGGFPYSVLHMALRINNTEAAKLLVKAGVDPIIDGYPGLIPILVEYFNFGTNVFMSWFFHHHLPKDELSKFVDDLLDKGNILKYDEKLWESVRREPAHALLTSGHMQMIHEVVTKCRELLSKVDSFQRTALHIAAENGDKDSVNALLEMNADLRCCDKSKMNPLMIAVQKDKLDVVEIMIKNDFRILVEEINPGVTMLHWALENGYSTFFKALRKICPPVFEMELDVHSNTIGHVAATAGHTTVFKALFPFDYYVYGSEAGMFDAILCKNLEKKTPLHLAVENDQLNILRTLQERVIEREQGKPCPEQNTERSVWEETWGNIGPDLLLHACSYGTVETVKYLIHNSCPPGYIRPEDNMTPLSCAAKAGNVEVVNYLLQLSSVRASGRGVVEVSPLYLAAENGHDKCITNLLKKSSEIPKSEYDCSLKIAIENKHSAAVFALIVDKTEEAMKSETSTQAIPMKLLIQHLPDVAEWVLNKCITIRGTPADEVKYDYRVLEENMDASVQPNYSGENNEMGNVLQQDAAGSENSSDTSMDNNYVDSVLNRNDSTGISKLSQDFLDKHILAIMVHYKRLKLLTHPLVQMHIQHKWRRVALPSFLAYLMIYWIFLILLSSFAIVSPRPGPTNRICTVNGTYSNPIYSSCEVDLDEMKEIYLTTSAILLYLLSFLFLTFEVVQLIRRRKKYFTSWPNYLQVLLFVCTVAFVSGFGNDCWCAPSWQWQTGAFAVFLGWLNMIVYLRHMPWAGIPINMLVNIIVTFLKLVFLPLLLLISFGLPFYMLFVRDQYSYEGTDPVGQIVSFLTPAHALLKATIQTAGEVDFETIFNEGDLLYNPMTYLLFIAFLILMPVLFSNLLIGLAVGDTQAEIEKATLTRIAIQVDFIWEIQSAFPFLRKYLRIPSTSFKNRDRTSWWKKWDKMWGVDYETHLNLAKKLQKEAQEIFDQVKVSSSLELLKVSMKDMITKVNEDIQMSLSAHKEDLQMFKKDVKEDIKEIKVNIAKLLKYIDTINEMQMKVGFCKI